MLPLVAVGGAGLGIAGASAAGLGNISAETIGSEVNVIAACDHDGVIARLDGFAVPACSTTFAFNQVRLTQVASMCNGAQYTVSVLAADKSVLNSSTGTLAVASSAATITLTGTGAPVQVSQAASLALLLVGP